MIYSISVGDYDYHIVEIHKLLYDKNLGIEIRRKHIYNKSSIGLFIFINLISFKIDREYLKNNYAFEFPDQFIIQTEKYIKMKAFS